MNTTCVCCGKEFEKLPDLMDHMTSSHTAEEIIAAVEVDEKEKIVYSPEKKDG
jgi:hypothetical protein